MVAKSAVGPAFLVDHAFVVRIIGTVDGQGSQVIAACPASRRPNCRAGCR